MTRQPDFERRVRRRMAKTGESYATARARIVAERTGGEETPWATALHVTNGDSTESGLRGTGLVHHILCWRDALHEGPVPDVPDHELRRIRARVLAADDAAELGTASVLAERDHALELHREGHYVLWFEADLYDQLQLIQIVAKLHELGVPPDRITLICIGEYPGIAHFGGLGELDADQLGRLPAMAATTLTSAALEHATRAWKLFRAPEPSGLGEIAAHPVRELRFVAEAFDRISREYPSTRDGLSLTERRILAAVAEGAPTAGAAFLRVGARETRPFLGDTWCFEAIRRLGGRHEPAAPPRAGPSRRGARAGCAFPTSGDASWTATRTTSPSTGSTAGSAGCACTVGTFHGAGAKGRRRSPTPTPSLAEEGGCRRDSELTRQQILAFRRRVGWPRTSGLPTGGGLAASGRPGPGLQDSMPRAALLSLHARVDGCRAVDVGAIASLAQLWGPRYSTYVVAERDFALFSLGRLPDDREGPPARRAASAERGPRPPRRRAHDRPRGGARARSSATRSGTPRRPARSRSAGTARGRRSSGASRRHDDRARPTRAASSPDATSTSSGRRPPTGFARWAGISRPRGGAPRSPRWRRSLAAGPIAARRRAGCSRTTSPRCAPPPASRRRARAPAAERRCVLPPPRRRAGAPRARARSSDERLWTLPRLARRAPRRRRDPRDLATRASTRCGSTPGRACRAGARDAVEAEASALPLPRVHGDLAVVWEP